VVTEIDVEQLDALLTGPEGDDVELVDVREPAEYAQAHVPGARLVPLGTLHGALGELPRDRRLYLLCAVGARSAAATEFLVAQGFDAVNVAGGTRAWVAAGKAYDQGH
jgi:rhodanese-related sulfurtransferase